MTCKDCGRNCRAWRVIRRVTKVPWLALPVQFDMAIIFAENCMRYTPKLSPQARKLALKLWVRKQKKVSTHDRTRTAIRHVVG